MGYLSSVGSGMASVKRVVNMPLTLASLCLLLSACGGDSPPIPSYTIGGTVTGLADNASMKLLDNGGDALTVAANGAFTFATPIAVNQAYAVTVGTPPLWQNCAVANGNGTAAANVTSVG
ncbi:hypothetical protein D7S86_28835, partial [Pararobbsia silviterrae]